jgi:cell division septal protein FtsQ
VQSKIQKDPMIQSCTVDMLDNNVVSIRVQEKKAVGYRYEDTPLILLEDGSTAELKSEYLSIIAKVPLVTGFSTQEQTHLLTKAFSAIDRSMIESIAEVDQFSLNYDDEALKILMRDGGYFISSYYGLSMINSYNEIYTQLSDKSLCIFAEDSTKVAYAKKCPWNETETQLEYWQNDDGSYITNKYGDKVVVHYYTDGEGNNYLDAKGSPIRIPVDIYGVEVPDENFEENWKAGYYDSGVFDASKVPATPAASAAAQNG